MGLSLVILRISDGYGFQIFIRCLRFESSREKKEGYLNCRQVDSVLERWKPVKKEFRKF